VQIQLLILFLGLSTFSVSIVFCEALRRKKTHTHTHTHKKKTPQKNKKQKTPTSFYASIKESQKVEGKKKGTSEGIVGMTVDLQGGGKSIEYQGDPNSS